MNTTKRVIGEWIKSTQDDLDTISLVSQASYLAPTCYHCGQAVEKMLKAYIIAKENFLIKTHDLEVLLERCESHSSDFSKFKKSCEDITTFSTIRYPPIKNVTVQQMEQTVRDTYEIVKFTSSKLKDLGYDYTITQNTLETNNMMTALKFHYRIGFDEVTTRAVNQAVEAGLSTEVIYDKIVGVIDEYGVEDADGVNRRIRLAVTDLEKGRKAGSE